MQQHAGDHAWSQSSWRLTQSWSHLWWCWTKTLQPTNNKICRVQYLQLQAWKWHSNSQCSSMHAQHSLRYKCGLPLIRMCNIAEQQPSHTQNAMPMWQLIVMQVSTSFTASISLWLCVLHACKARTSPTNRARTSFGTLSHKFVTTTCV